MGDELDAMRWRAGDVDRITEQADRVHKLDIDQRGGGNYFGGFARGRRQPSQEEVPNDEGADRLAAEIHDDIVLSDEAKRLLESTPPPEPQPATPGTDTQGTKDGPPPDTPAHTETVA
jgi:hypothetical protein